MTKLKLFLIIFTVSFFLQIAGISAASQGQLPKIANTQSVLSTAFTYQASLSNSQGPVIGHCDLRFILFDAVTAGNLVGGPSAFLNAQINKGLFVVTLDFGNVFQGNARWLETAVRCPASNGDYIILSPRQQIGSTPYAFLAENVRNVTSSASNFTAYGDLRSSKAPNDGETAGALVLENLKSRNSWVLDVRAVEEDELGFNFWDATAGHWRYGARLDRNSNFTVQGGLFSGWLTTNRVIAHGDLESVRASDGVNAGALILGNETTGNKWSIPIRAENGDSLDFHFWDAGASTWRRLASLENQGMLAIEQINSSSATVLRLDHPQVQWEFHVDAEGHPEFGIYDVTTNTKRWNVFDIDKGTGNIGIGDNALPGFKLAAFGQVAILTRDPNSTTLLQLQHPKTQLHVHVDASAHTEFGIKNVETNQTTWNVLDIERNAGHIGIGGDATDTDSLKVYGNFTATGTKAATVNAGEYGLRKLYAVEAPDVRFSDEGLAQLENGDAHVVLDPIFVETIEQPYIIHITPYGNASLYVDEVTQDGFTVKLHEGKAQVTFAWRLSAPRKGYSNVRLETVD